MVAGRFSRTIPDEDEALSDAFLALNNAINRFNPWAGYNFSTYACSAMANGLSRKYNANKRHSQLFPLSHEPDFERPPAHTVSDDRELLERLPLVLENGILNDMEKIILRRRFPQDGAKGQTLRQIGSLVGLSDERVRQLQNAALRKLKELLEEESEEYEHALS